MVCAAETSAAAVGDRPNGWVRGLLKCVFFSRRVQGRAAAANARASLFSLNPAVFFFLCLPWPSLSDWLLSRRSCVLRARARARTIPIHFARLLHWMCRFAFFFLSLSFAFRTPTTQQPPWRSLLPGVQDLRVKPKAYPGRCRNFSVYNCTGNWLRCKINNIMKRAVYVVLGYK